MHTEHIALEKTGFFSQLICDYVAEKQEVKPFYHRPAKIESFQEQMAEKRAFFSQEKREKLVQALSAQYQGVETSEATQKNIDNLLKNNTFTITTGHQLSLFTGPLYFIYKIISAINTAKILSEKYPENQFVPVYWMASEDHDFEEINHFYLFGKKIVWNRPNAGAVGHIPTADLEAISQMFSEILPEGKQAQKLKNLFREAYLNHSNMSAATHFLVNALFGEYGLVILDGDDPELKREFVPYFKEDLLAHTAEKIVKETAENLHKTNAKYPIQVSPRKINIFYLQKGQRQRIIQQNNFFVVNHTDIRFTQEEILQELERHPERFSPNVVLRPVYQEVILPNLCYIGGGGELAYWLELRPFFDEIKVPFPILMLRNSFLLIDAKQKQKMEKLGISARDLFLKEQLLSEKIARRLSTTPIDFSEQKEFLRQQFTQLYHIAQQTDKTFLGAVQAQEKKQFKGLEHLEKRLLKAQKKRYQNFIERVLRLKNELFPNGGLQERTDNFSQYMLSTQGKLIEILIQHTDPLRPNFTILYTE